MQSVVPFSYNNNQIIQSFQITDLGWEAMHNLWFGYHYSYSKIFDYFKEELILKQVHNYQQVYLQLAYINNT